MRRIRVFPFPFSGETVQMQTAFYSVTMESFDAIVYVLHSSPHSCIQLFEDHFWD